MIFHNSRDSFYRTPQGAGVCESVVNLRVRTDLRPREVVLRLWWEQAEKRLVMAQESEGVYHAMLTLPGHTGLLWYYFVLTGENGQVLYYGNAYDHLGGEGAIYSCEPPSFQITVYDARYQPPQWMREGVMYQIMVDRFCASRPVSRRPAPEHGHWHADWYEPPELVLDESDSARVCSDFYGGDLEGVRKKLGYLKRLGVSVIYFNPIFRAPSNHKYNTGDYMQIDPGFGTERDFTRLCQDAAQLGIRIMLDGVFSHTGSDSRYFNREGNYDSLGAYQSPKSPYASWYTFFRWPDLYDSWWGFDTLPNVNEMDEKYLDFIIRDEDAVCAHYLRAGASGWRLDVADELPMPFLRMLRERVKRENPDSALLGEVWEDASNKVAYGRLRSYCIGDTLDSCMNYPLRDAVLGFFLGTLDAPGAVRRIESLHENYPRPFFYSLMNLLSSHDKPRAISALSGAGDMEPPREKLSAEPLSPEAHALGRRRFIAAWRLVCALPGMPSMYYADEAGAEGMRDPMCRGAYPWGREDKALVREVGKTARMRRQSALLTRGEMRLYAPCGDVIVCARYDADGMDAFGQPMEPGLVVCAVNRADAPVKISLPPDDLFPRGLTLNLEPISAAYRKCVRKQGRPVAAGTPAVCGAEDAFSTPSEDIRLAPPEDDCAVPPEDKRLIPAPDACTPAVKTPAI